MSCKSQESVALIIVDFVNLLKHVWKAMFYKQADIRVNPQTLTISDLQMDHE